ncbi:MAG: hypothetical protein R3C26_09315 [Calditrichia bacterium]
MSHKILIYMMTLLFSAGLLAQANLLPNGNLESQTPNFWSEWNAQSGATMTLGIGRGSTESVEPVVAEPVFVQG